MLEERLGCEVTGCDVFPLAEGIKIHRFLRHDLNDGPPPVEFAGFDHILMLDVIEHLHDPEKFVERLRALASGDRASTIIVTTGNVAFAIVRLMLLFGQFNYGKRGILDLTHTRLFTFGSIRHLFECAGFDIIETKGIPAPFELIFANGLISRTLSAINRVLIRLMRNMFSYQIMLVVRPRPTLASFLEAAVKHSAARFEEWRQARQEPECIVPRNK